MNKTLLAIALLSTVHAAQAACDYTPDRNGFKFDFTAYGAKDKSYVVSKNTFNKFELASASGRLLGATIDIDAASVDTSHDLNNGSGGQWPPTFPAIRNGNVVNGLFRNFANPGRIAAKVSAIDARQLKLDVTMNGVTRAVPMSYKVADGVLSAEGKLDILDFNGAEAFRKFEALCTVAWHKGKSWTDVAIFFTVPVKEKGCQ
ncbi:YceI family protein [Methyloversatilis thermotolerans]|uniref:YceI family protein n=1 Tax=Methyloversatilis thermotolerans TaxID=1346290 RepID=UPI001E3C9D07|nr:YceI family protein [Methyloversatilis thermotolerans]